MSFLRCYICDSKGARSYKGQAPICSKCNSIAKDALWEMSEPWEHIHAWEIHSERDKISLAVEKRRREETDDDDPDTGHRDGRT